MEITILGLGGATTNQKLFLKWNFQKSNEIWKPI